MSIKKVDKTYLELQFSNFATRVSNVFAKQADLPTKTSDLTNDSNFVSDSNYTHIDNNYTDSEKTKLENIETKAQVNKIEEITVNNVKQTITDKSVNISVPTKASDIGAIDGNVTHLSGDVPNTRKINNKELSSDITLSATDVGAIDSIIKGQANGVAELDENGKVPSTQLPSYVDDVIEGTINEDLTEFTESGKSTPLTPESGKIYVEITQNKTYRWSGSKYVVTGGGGVSLGETSSTAYRGDRGKTAYDHSQLTSGNPHGVTKGEVGLGNVGNFKAVSTVANQGLTTTEQANARENIGAGTSSFDGNYNSLSNKPTIPTVNDSTIKIQKNGTDVQSFTTNQSTGATVNITVPTKTSELTNDSGYKTTDNNTTYTFNNGTTVNTFTVTPSGGTKQTITITPALTWG